MGDGEQSTIDSLLQSGGESSDLKRLLLMFSRLGLLQAQVHKTDPR
jgi:hypothetical protein